MALGSSKTQLSLSPVDVEALLEAHRKLRDGAGPDQILQRLKQAVSSLVSGATVTTKGEANGEPVLCVPVEGKGGNVLVTLEIRRPERGALDRREEGIIRLLAAMAGLELENFRLRNERRWSDARFQQVIEHSPFAYQIYSPEGDNLYANPAWEKVTQTGRDQLQGYNILRDPNAQRPETAEIIQRAFRGERVSLPDYYYDPATIGRKGRARWIRVHLFPISEDGTAIREVVQVAEDTTDAHRLVAEANRREEDFRQIAEAIPQIVFRNDAEARSPYIYINQRWSEYTGLPPEVPSPEDWATVLAPEDAKRSLEVWDECLRTGRSFEMEYRLRRHDGEMRWHLARACPMRNAEGKITLWFGTLTDIHEQKTLQENLRKSEEQFRTLADALPHLVWVTDASGNNVYVNARWREYYGPDAIAHGKGWERFVHPEDYGRTLEIWKHSLKTGEPAQADYRVRDRDGNYRWFLARAVAVKDAAGQIVRWFGTSTDIDETRRTAEELRQRTDALERSNEELEQFAYVASHDLKEPLRAITLFLQLLERDFKQRLDPRAGEYIQFATEGARRMLALIDDLLMYSRAGRVGNPQPTATEQVLRAAMANLEAASEEAEAEIFHGALPVVEGNFSELVQLFQNLLQNAIKFRRREVSPRIHVHAEREGSLWHFQLRDNGIGIESEYWEKIFLIFQRLHRPEEYEGTGVGLALCRRVVSHHGGRIWVESVPGEGATFHFTLPASRH